MSDSTFFQSYDVVLFDLDNTLYAEKDYLYAAYRTIGEKLTQLHPELNSEAISTFLIHTFETAGREQLFNKLIVHFNIQQIEIDQLLLWMREVELPEKLLLFPTSQALLIQALSQCKVFVITNGNVLQQQNKVNQIDWGGLRKHIEVIYANATKPKPAPESFQSLQIPSHLKCLYIGDTETDQLFARNCGIDFRFIQEFNSEN